MHYNICLVRPEGYIHTDAFIELAELLMHSIIDLGETAQITENTVLNDGAKNIIIGCHLLAKSAADSCPSNSIVLNTEQVHMDQTCWSEIIYFWVSRFETWDYSELNMERLREVSNMPIKHLSIGFQRHLAKIPNNASKDIDVLFYGSVNERRANIINALLAKGVNVKPVFGVYGSERDELIARSKIILNLHFYDSKIFEIVRVFYLMTNRKAILCEVSPDTNMPAAYESGIYKAPYESLVDSCLELLSNEKKIMEVEENAFNCISKLPQAEIMRSLLYFKS
jgi:hypothetical protein